MTLITNIKSVQSREELTKLLEKETIEVRYILVTNAVDSLNKEIEADITTGDVDVALYKMSQVVLLEDALHVIERVILKQRVIHQ